MTQLSLRCLAGLLTVVVGVTVAWSQQQNRPPVVTRPPSATTSTATQRQPIGSGVAKTPQHQNSNPRTMPGLPRPSSAGKIPGNSTNPQRPGIQAPREPLPDMPASTQTSMPVGAGVPQPIGVQRTYARSRQAASLQAVPRKNTRPATLGERQVAGQPMPQRRKAPSARGGNFGQHRSPGLIQSDPATERNTPAVSNTATLNNPNGTVPSASVRGGQPSPNRVSESGAMTKATQKSPSLLPDSSKTLPQVIPHSQPPRLTHVAATSATAPSAATSSGAPRHLVETMKQLQGTYRQQAMLLSRLVPHVQPGQRADLQKAIKRAQASRAKLATQLGRMQGAPPSIVAQSSMTASPIAAGVTKETDQSVRMATAESVLPAPQKPRSDKKLRETPAEPPQPPQGLTPMSQFRPSQPVLERANTNDSDNDFYGRAE